MERIKKVMDLYTCPFCLGNAVLHTEVHRFPQTGEPLLVYGHVECTVCGAKGGVKVRRFNLPCNDLSPHVAMLRHDLITQWNMWVKHAES